MKTEVKDVNICQVCSFPKELCICENLETEDQQIKIYNEKRRWGKDDTIVKFKGDFNIDLDKLITKAKKKCASGGTFRDNHIELQGEHRYRLKKFLIKEGFPKENIFIDN